MIRLGIVVEGATEEAFVKMVLAEHLRPMEVDPVQIGDRRRRSRGGNVSVDELVLDMVNRSNELDMVDRSYKYGAVTSLVDFYGFDGKKSRTVEELEILLRQKIEARSASGVQVFPYVQKHEFEGLLFSDTAAFRVLRRANPRRIAVLEAVRQQFATPEDINDDPSGAPSERIKQAVPGYRKPRDGPEVAREAGLEKIRAECPRFHEWLTRMERLAQPT